MNHFITAFLQVINQPPPIRRFNIPNILIEYLNDFYAKLMAIFTAIYVTVSFLKILGIIHDPIIPDPFNTLIIALIVLYFISYIIYNAYKLTKKRIQEFEDQNKELTAKIGNLTDHNIRLTCQIQELTNKIEILSFIKPKDPSVLIDDHLGYIDVKFAIYCLSKKIEDSGFFGDKDSSGRYDPKKNIIIGIDRGGAIVGGLLAKNLGVTIKTLAINWADALPLGLPRQVADPLHRSFTSIRLGKCLENIKFEDVKNILIVDDAIRNGHAMLAAINSVGGKLNNIPSQFIDDTHHIRTDMININIACILFTQVANPIIQKPDFCVYQTRLNQIWMLWDTTRPEMKIRGEEKRIFDEYYGCIPKDLLSDKKLQ